MVGANNREQLQLNCSLLYPALNLRITEHAVLSPYFNEDPRAVLEGTIASIQSDRIFGGGGNLLEGKLGRHWFVYVCDVVRFSNNIISKCMYFFWGFNYHIKSWSMY